MSRVSLHFEDTPDGQLAFRADFIGGPNSKSRAHAMASACIKFLDGLAEKKEGIQTTVVNETMREQIKQPAASKLWTPGGHTR